MIDSRSKLLKLGSRLRVNSSRIYLTQFAVDASNSIAPDSKVLDAGAGDCVYQRHFSAHRYESADFCQVEKEYGRIDYVCDLTQLPVEDARFDLVFCSQVLEHLPEPAAALREFNRVLKPGAVLWLSAPFFYVEHEQPYDYYRYTQFGLRHLLESSGFEVERVDWLEGYCSTLAYQLEVAAVSLPLKASHFGGGPVGYLTSLVSLLIKPLFIALSLLYSRVDRRHKFTDAGLCKNYAIVARKPKVAR